MRKSSIALVVVAALAAAYAGGSWYVGKQAQAVLEQGVQDANQRLIKALGPDPSGNQIKLGIQEYQRGVFSSQVVYTLTLRDMDGKPLELRLGDYLQHGPFPWARVSAGDFSPLLAYSEARLLPTQQTQRWFDSVADGAAPLSIRSRLDFSREGTSAWTFAPASHKGDGESFTFSGGKLDLAFSNDFADSDGQGGFASLEFIDETGALKVQDVALRSQSRQQQEDVTQADSSATIGNIVVRSADDSTVTLKNVEIDASGEQQGKRFDGELRYTLGSVLAGELDLGSFALGLKAKGLDIDALTALATEIDRLNTENPDADLSEGQLQALEAPLLALLKSEPTLSIDPLVWKNDKGQSQLKLDADLFLPQPERDGDAELDVDGFGLEYLRKGVLDVSVSRDMFSRLFGQLQGGDGDDAPAAALGAMMFDQYAARLASAGLAKVEDGKAGATLVYLDEDDSIELNGQKMPLEAFVQRVLLATM